MVTSLSFVKALNPHSPIWTIRDRLFPNGVCWPHYFAKNPRMEEQPSANVARIMMPLRSTRKQIDWMGVLLIFLRVGKKAFMCSPSIFSRKNANRSTTPISGSFWGKNNHDFLSTLLHPLWSRAGSLNSFLLWIPTKRSEGIGVFYVAKFRVHTIPYNLCPYVTN